MFPLLLFCNYPGGQATGEGLPTKTAGRRDKHAMTVFAHRRQIAAEVYSSLFT